MSVGSKAVKKTALTTLKSQLLPCVFSAIIVVFSFFCCSLTSSLLSFAKIEYLAVILNYLMLFFLFSPLFYGFLRFYWRIIMGVTDNCISVFFYFSNLQKYIKIIKLQSILSLKALIRGIIFFIPAIFVELISYEFFYDF